MEAADPSCGIACCDAHNHLHDPPLQGCFDMEPGGAPLPRISAMVVNGTHPGDWDAVGAVAGPPGTRILRAYGIHPWRVGRLPPHWEQQLRARLRAGAASVGEIGVDHWIEPRDERLQIDVFERQLALAAELRLPPSIHCVRAWGLLLDILRAAPPLPRGFLVHGFGGSRETLFEILDLGGHVSFSAYAAHPRRQRAREAIRACPADRLLAETDAPDMVPPAAVCRYPLAAPDGAPLHHPAEIATATAFLAETRGEPLPLLAARIEATFEALFGRPADSHTGSISD